MSIEDDTAKCQDDNGDGDIAIDNARRILETDKADTLFSLQGFKRLVVRDREGKIVMPTKLRPDDLLKEMEGFRHVYTANITMFQFKYNPCRRLVVFGGDCYWEDCDCSAPDAVWFDE